MQVRGDYYEAGTSRRTPALLDLGRDGTLTVLVDGRRLGSALLREARVTDRVGDTPRIIHLPGGAVFETTENAAIDAALALHGLGRGPRLLHRLESRWRMVALLLLVVAGVAGWTVIRGLPLLAERVAFALPASVQGSLARGALDVLDRTLFEPTALDAATRGRITSRFDSLAAEADVEPAPRLVFRKSPRVGANAFALPSGEIILTDELVELAHHDDELVAVLAHETGHVVHRHGLRHALQSSTLALLALAVTGDAAMVSSFAAALPALLVQARYSRTFEREADRYTLDYLTAQGIEPGRFGCLLRRLASGQEDEPLIGFLTTHPSPAERVARFGDCAPAEAGAGP